MAKRILVTDDALFMRVPRSKNILTQNGFEVVGEASNGREAVELYEAQARPRVYGHHHARNGRSGSRSKRFAPKTPTPRW